MHANTHCVRRRIFFTTQSVFNFLPLDGTKGELLLVRIPDLKLNKIIKSNVFIIPLGNDVYKVGATYDWQDKTDQLTVMAKMN